MNRIHCYICEEFIGETSEETNIVLCKRCYYGEASNQTMDAKKRTDIHQIKGVEVHVIKQISFPSSK
ncbi:hypothetical protein [Lysinibacillus fusiformis]|uniref:hypothetical protein n=1 Tax=Lysinibacillus fusiformis TaxID=28031 RepID=UPI0037180977